MRPTISKIEASGRIGASFGSSTELAVITLTTSSLPSAASLVRVAHNSDPFLVFAFVDKEGIISEMSKYVDEMAVIDKKEQKVVLDLVHDTHAAFEEEIY